MASPPTSSSRRARKTHHLIIERALEQEKEIRKMKCSPWTAVLEEVDVLQGAGALAQQPGLRSAPAPLILDG